MARITSQSSAGNFFGCHPRTIRNWIEKGFIRGYRDGNSILVDIDEIEHAIQTNPRVRDPRRAIYGETAKIVPLPFRAEVVPEVEQ